MLVFLRETTMPNAMKAKRVTQSPPPSVNPMAWRVIPSLPVKIAALESGFSVGETDGTREGEGDGIREGERDGNWEADGAAVKLVSSFIWTVTFGCLLMRVIIAS
jgi:hypothetical protein